MSEPATQELQGAALIMFNDPSIQLEHAGEALGSHSLTVEPSGEFLITRWDDGPRLYIALRRGPQVQEITRLIGEGSPYAEALGNSDSWFEIGFENLEEVLDELNTLTEAQLTLLELTGGICFNTWNETFLTPDGAPNLE
ncbi:MAG: hypothetical protein GEU75_13005 [Dehalococcoidia bacterium]|nr:hypothetical protein [Dehalococcoidia bacterium]